MARASGRLQGYVQGLGLIGPGLRDWPQGAAVLAGTTAYCPQPTQYPTPQGLPAAERRRASKIVKLTLSAGREACTAAGLDPANLASVFASSGGDGENCHAICEALAGDDRRLSPTRFHNSVNNAAAGYWDIATGSMEPATVVCAFDGSFAAGLLETLAQVTQERRAVLLVAYDCDYPEPLREVRPIPDGLGVALVLAPEPNEETLARIDLGLTGEPVTTLADGRLEALRSAIPAARSLTLLEALARRGPARPVLDYLGDLGLAVEVQPWPQP
jgi:hypothetical protein